MSQMDTVRAYQKTRNELARKLAEDDLVGRQRGNYEASFEQLSDEISYYLSRQHQD